MSERSPGTGKGLLESLTTLFATLVGMVHTRLDLLSADLEDALDHASGLLVLVVTALFCGAVGVVLASILIVAAFWDTHRLLVLGGLAALFLAVAAVTVWLALHRVRARPRLFSASLSELFKDQQQLVSRS